MVSRDLWSWTMVLACVVTASPRMAAADAPAPERPTSMPASAPATADRYEGEWAYRVRSWQRQSAVSVTVEASGLGESARSATAEPEPCTTFRPSERQIRSYVARARHVSRQGFVHESDWSACHATGRMRFRDGVNAEWMVQRLGAGYIVIAGRRYYLDCPDCVLESTAAGAKR